MRHRPARRQLGGRHRLPPVVAVVAVLGMTLAACSTGSNAVDPNSGGDMRYVVTDKQGGLAPPASRPKLPPISGESLLGNQTVKLSNYRGKVLILNFWASWCAPCREEAPGFEQLYQADRHRGLALVGIDVKDSGKQFGSSFVTNKHLTYPNIYDPDSRIALQLHNTSPNAIPSTLLVDRRGRIAATYLGAQEPSALAKPIDTLLAER